MQTRYWKEQLRQSYSFEADWRRYTKVAQFESSYQSLQSLQIMTHMQH